MANKIRFICPNCNRQTMDTVTINVTVFMPVETLEEDEKGEVFSTYKDFEPDNEGGELSHYECYMCKYKMAYYEVKNWFLQQKNKNRI